MWRCKGLRLLERLESCKSCKQFHATEYFSLSGFSLRGAFLFPVYVIYVSWGLFFSVSWSIRDTKQPNLLNHILCLKGMTSILSVVQDGSAHVNFFTVVSRYQSKMLKVLKPLASNLKYWSKRKMKWEKSEQANLKIINKGGLFQGIWMKITW